MIDNEDAVIMFNDVELGEGSPTEEPHVYKATFKRSSNDLGFALYPEDKPKDMPDWYDGLYWCKRIEPVFPELRGLYRAAETLEEIPVSLSAERFKDSIECVFYHTGPSEDYSGARVRVEGEDESIEVCWDHYPKLARHFLKNNSIKANSYFWDEVAGGEVFYVYVRLDI
jgi:hypothetical protein